MRKFSPPRYLNEAEIPLTLKEKRMDSCILLSLTYGSQVWSLRRKNEESFKIYQRTLERNFF